MDDLRYYALGFWAKILYRLKMFFILLPGKLLKFLKAIPTALWKGLKKIGNGFKNFYIRFKEGDAGTKASYIVMGAGCFKRKQIVKGIIYLAIEVLYVLFMIFFGVKYIGKLGTLGTTEAGWVFDPNLGINVLQDGDNSMLILLYGIMSILITLFFIGAYLANIISSYSAQKSEQKGEKAKTFKQELKELLDAKFYKTILLLPVIGILLFTILPLIYMILIAFTNYNREHQPPQQLFTWIGFENFKTIFSLNPTVTNSFWGIFGWTIVWAIVATVTNYIGGIVVAMLINKKGVKAKALFRTALVLSVAIPQFITLLTVRNMLGEFGIINFTLQNMGLIDKALPFLTNENWARVVVIIVNLWVGIPYTMLITTGILMNIPEELYESARMDGANIFVIFIRITIPFVLFVTAPYLITQFIGNINNFNIIFLLTGGGPLSTAYYQAGKTDLLVTWLYKLTVTEQNYSLAASIGIIVFVISAIISLIAYNLTPSIKKEEEYQ